MKKRLKSTYDKIDAQNEFIVTEAYRSARTSIDFSTIGSTCKIIVFTSPAQGDGKTTTAINIAGAFARKLDTRVLIIDCDLRKPRIAKYLNIKNKKGLTDYLCKKISKEEIILSTEIEGLSAIVSGTIPPNPSELLASARMKAFVNELKEDFDYIIIDTPPINLVSDVLSVGDISDGVVAVIRAKKNTTKDIDAMLSDFKSANLKLLGFILNGTVKKKESKYKYGRYKHYGYDVNNYSDYAENINTGDTNVC